MGCQKHFTKLQKMKNTQTKTKPIKIEKQSGTMYVLGVKIISRILGQTKVKMTNKLLREKSHCVVCRSNKSRFLKQKHSNRK